MSNTANKVVVNGKTIYVAKFHSQESAERYAYSNKKLWVVLGDYDDSFGGFWVCRPVDANKLMKCGYELAK